VEICTDCSTMSLSQRTLELAHVLAPACALSLIRQSPLDSSRGQEGLLVREPDDGQDLERGISVSCQMALRWASCVEGLTKTLSSERTSVVSQVRRSRPV
jgi:hypothetical protein